MAITISTDESDTTKEKEEHPQKLCPVCHEVAIDVYPVERIPGKSLFMRAIHQDDKVCEWAKHESISAVQQTKSELRNIADIDKCPNCGRIGKIITEQKDSRNPWIITYSIEHADGEQCKITSQEGRDIVLKTLDRFIDPRDREVVVAEMRPIPVPILVNECVTCGSKTTWINKRNGYHQWYNTENGTICSKCHSQLYNKRKAEEEKSKIKKECSVCHSHTTYQRKDGRVEWYNAENGEKLCSHCYDMQRKAKKRESQSVMMTKQEFLQHEKELLEAADKCFAVGTLIYNMFDQQH